MERAAYTSTFGFERRLGFSAQYAGKLLVVQGGVFSDDVAALNNDNDKNWSLDGRIVAMPSLAGGTLHLGLSGHWRDLNGGSPTVRYSARPFIHTTDVRFVDTGNLSAIGERGFGGELAWIRGRFHATAESFWQTVRRRNLPDPTFNGGYAELGYLLTDDVTAYKNGVYDRIVPKRGVDKGGIGAIQINARYDWLDLNDAGIVGGRQQVAGVSAIWMPIAYVRFILNYGHIWIDDSVIDANGDRNFTADALGMRAQLDF
jgi:phosphate-selective porin OprO/OprP